MSDGAGPHRQIVEFGETCAECARSGRFDRPSPRPCGRPPLAGAAIGLALGAVI